MLLFVDGLHQGWEGGEESIWKLICNNYVKENNANVPFALNRLHREIEDFNDYH